ncbi:protein containing DUF480 [Candidatus Magnetomorum sp. HK-1]|nr:protein containing DUF480 [Candidatus Magnetomorum sp. HK-1]
MEIILNNEEIRVLGCLIEKEMATPDYYPLTLNALLNGCNQKSNRDPVVSYDEKTVLQALDQLKKKELVWQSNLGRVPKYEERFTVNNKFVSKESAIMCVLLLRGPQTVGEIKNRTERLHAFENLGEVNETLENLALSNFVEQMPRRPGQKEARFRQMMCEHPENDDTSGSTNKAQSIDIERLVLLEEKVESLSSELETLKQSFLTFKQQFE